MKQMKNQTGITLIEVLATITILSIVTVIIYSVFSNGLNYSSQAEDTVLIQQEANYLLTILKEQHENGKPYTVTVNENHQKVTIGTSIIESEQFEYQILDTQNSIDAATKPIEISPSFPLNESFHVRIIVKSKKDTNLKYEIETILSRL